jgi:hypothetical protein
MELDKKDMPLKTAAEITLTAEEKKAAAAEMRARDAAGHQINLNSAAVSRRYTYSKYLIDPCRFSWSKVVRVVAIMQRFISRCRAAVSRSWSSRCPWESSGSGLAEGSVALAAPLLAGCDGLAAECVAFAAS